MIGRNLENELAETIEYNRSLFLFGPRQTGKTTLLNVIAKGYRNISEATMNVGVKEQVIKSVETLPFKIQVDKELQELDEGKGIPHQEVEKRLSRWLSK